MTTANVNIKKVLFRRGNTIQNDNYVGVIGEVSVDTEANTLRIHDGTTSGGTRLATYAELTDLAVGNIDLTGYATTAQITAANVEIGKLRANITAANVAWTANAASQASSINTLSANIGAYQTYANTTFTGGSTYSNTNVTAFLTTVNGNIIPSANGVFGLGDSTHWWRDIYVGSNTIYLAGVPLSIDANGDLLVDGNVIQGGNVDLTTVNANITAANSTIQTTNANIGAYQTWANTNAAIQTTSINTVNANIGAYQTWANTNAASQTTSINALRANITAANVEIATLQTQVYSNVNAAAYLAGAITVGNITAGNITVETNAVVLGNLRVVGTQTTVNATTLNLTDLFVTVANGATQASDANGAGLRVAGANANISYSSVSDSFEFNKPIAVTSVNFANGVSILDTVANLTNGGNVVSLGSTGNLTLPTNLNFSTSPASQNTGIIFGDGTWQRTAYQGPGSVLVNGPHNAALDSTGNLTVPGSILPNTDIAFDLGSPTMRFRHLYVGPGTVYVGNAAIKTTTSGNLILPGVTRPVASTAFVEEVEDEGDQTHSFTTNPTIIDNAHYSFLDGNFQNLSFTPATYSSTGIDGEGYIRNITIDTAGSGYSGRVAELAEQDMWATEAADPINNFVAGDWTQIPFRAETRAGESEYEFDSTAVTDRLSNNGNEVVLDSDGDLTLPGAISIGNGDGSIARDGDDLVISWDNESLILKSVSDHVEVEADSDFKISVRNDGNDYTGKWVFTQDNELVNISTDTGIVSEGGELRLQGGRDTLSSANVKIVSVNNGVAIHNWTFATTGNVVFPDGTEQSTAYTGGGGGNANTGNVIFDGDTLYVGGVGFLDLDNSDNQIEIGSNNNGPVIVSVSEGANRWEFGANGVLALPPGGDIVNSNGVSVLGGNTSTTNQLVNSIYELALQANGAVSIPGAIVAQSVDPASYRGFYATVNQISEQGGGSEDDPSLNQIILSRSATMRGYNLSDDTNDDTFFANGITGSSHVAVINLYGEDTSNPLDLDDIKIFIQTYIDLVLYDGTTLRTDVADIQTAFAAAQTDLVDSLPANALRSDFKFNEIQAVINTAGMTTSGSGSGFVYYYNTDTADYSGSDETDILVAGTGYQINDTITVPGTALGGIAPADNMTITVAGVDGSGGITSIDRSGSMDSGRFANLFVKHFIIEGYDDAYDQGNGIGTDRSECVFIATANTATERITVSAVTSGELAPFQAFSQDNDYNYMILHQVSGTAGGAGVYVTGGYDTIDDEATATTYTANGIYYGINDPQYDSAAFGGGDYVSMVNTEVGIFTMVAVNADIDRVSYIGETGADSDGIKILTASFDIGNGTLESLPVELVVGTNTWTFENTGNLTLPQTSNVGITFSDGTFQKTAYKRPDNLMLDGGGAATIYEVAVEYAEGGFSATRYGVNTPSFDGGGAELEEAIYYTLDGGGA